MFLTLKAMPTIQIICRHRQCRFRQFSCSKKSLSSKNVSGDKMNIRHNFHKECEEGLNKQINLELQASYTYFCMSTCLGRPDVALQGYSKFFAAASDEERNHAQMLATFVNTRGGEVELRDVAAPAGGGTFHDPAHALQYSIDLERSVLVSLEELHKTASAHGDAHLVDFLETHFIPEGYEGIKHLAEMLTRVQRAGPGVGVILLDLDLQRHPPNMHA